MYGDFKCLTKYIYIPCSLGKPQKSYFFSGPAAKRGVRTWPLRIKNFLETLFFVFFAAPLTYLEFLACPYYADNTITILPEWVCTMHRLSRVYPLSRALGITLLTLCSMGDFTDRNLSLLYRGIRNKKMGKVKNFQV